MEKILILFGLLDDYLSVSQGRLTILKKLVGGLLLAGTVNLKEICARFTSGSQKTNYRKAQYFFAKAELSTAEVIRFVIKNLFKDDEPLTFALDRTDWAFGKTRHNLLCLSVLYAGTAIPLVVLPLEREGNSDTEQRRAVLDALLSAVPVYRIKAILGDREFLGDAWLRALKARYVPFVMRMRENITVGTTDKVCMIKELYASSVEASGNGVSSNIQEYGSVQIGADTYRLTVTENKGELVALASYDVKEPLKLYRKRWGIEVGFKCLKSNGFNLEKTHMTDPGKIKTLVQLCAIAMTLSFINQEQEEQTASIKKNTD